MNFFASKIDNIREIIITMQLSTTVSQQTVHCSVPEENHLSIAIGEEELSTLVKSSACMLDPISTKLLKEMLPIIDPLMRLHNNRLLFKPLITFFLKTSSQIYPFCQRY